MCKSPYSKDLLILACLILQERTSGVLSSVMAQKSCSSGVPRPRISLLPRTPTSPCTLLHHVGHSKSMAFCTVCALCVLSSNCKDFFPFQASSWATRFWVTGKTWPSPSAWTGGTRASLQRTWCWKGLGWECRCRSLPRATPTPVRMCRPTPSGMVGAAGTWPGLPLASDLLRKQRSLSLSLCGWCCNSTALLGRELWEVAAVSSWKLC